jgi:hypothetical protein
MHSYYTRTKKTAAASGSRRQAMKPPVDVMAKHHVALTALFVKFGNELLDIVAASKNVNVEDVRERTLKHLVPFGNELMSDDESAAIALVRMSSS